LNRNAAQFDNQFLNLDENALNVVVDGSSLPAPRRGGAGLRFVWVDSAGAEQVIDEPSAFAVDGATNNQMELQAAIEVLKRATTGKLPIDRATISKIVIHSDSRYVTDHVNTAIYSWPKNRWMTRDGGPVSMPHNGRT
jgi:ribonuclease HI